MTLTVSSKLATVEFDRLYRHWSRVLSTPELIYVLEHVQRSATEALDYQKHGAREKES